MRMARALSRGGSPEVGRRVRSARYQQGWTQAQLAAKAGVPKNLVGCVERGQCDPPLTVLIRIGRALGVDPAVLLRGLLA